MTQKMTLNDLCFLIEIVRSSWLEMEEVLNELESWLISSTNCSLLDRGSQILWIFCLKLWEYTLIEFLIQTSLKTSLIIFLWMKRMDCSIAIMIICVTHSGRKIQQLSHVHFNHFISTYWLQKKPTEINLLTWCKLLTLIDSRHKISAF